MKSSFLLSLLVTAFVFSKAQPSKNEYYIEGAAPGLKTGKAYLSEFVIEGKRDSVMIQNGSFSFNGKFENPMPVLLRLQGNKGSFLFFAENGKMKLTLDVDSLKNSKLTGSASNKDYQEYEGKIRSQNDRLNELSAWSRSKGKLDKATSDSVENVWEGIDNERKMLVRDFIKTHPNSVVAAYTITRHFMVMPDIPELEAQYNSLSAQVQQSSFGRQIKEKVDIEKRTGVGRVAPDFSQADTLGKVVALKEFRGKYVLVDFWASWCVPCRQENPNVVAAYKKYHDKGFDILAVSLDDKKESWLKAIKQDGLTWQHVSELSSWNNSAAKLYGVNAIPSNFLLDPAGTIIGKNLDGEKLQAKLGEVIK